MSRRKPSILVVDDEPNARFGVAHTLQEWGGEGARIDCAENGAEALDLLRSGEYDLLLSDIRMPIMDGIKLLETLREDNDPIRCILLTGFAEFEYARSALKLGVADYLLKPVQQDQLVQAVEKALTDRRQDEPEPGRGAEPSPRVPVVPEDSPVGKAVQYIHEHVHEALPIKDVAAHVHLNASYLSVLFKEEMGITFIDYVTEYRMKKAKELLLGSSVSLEEISERIGYQSTSYFIKIFKKHEQMTPKHYRDQRIRGGRKTTPR